MAKSKTKKRDIDNTNIFNFKLSNNTHFKNILILTLENYR